MSNADYGSIDHPLSLDVALRRDVRIMPGHNIYLRAGTYSGDFVSTLAGTAENPIVIQPYQNETVIIDGSLNVTGNYTTWKDLIITYSGWTARDNAPEGDLKSVNLRGTGNKMIGCILHDTFLNGSWVNVGGGFYECLIYNCGCHRASSNTDEGHAIYTQNQVATQYHHNNILWGQYGFGFHGYTEGANSLDYFDIRQNICFRNNGRDFVLGGLGGQRAHNCVVDENIMLEGDGYLKGNDITLTNNYSPNGFTIEPTSENVTQSSNTFTPPGSGTNIFIFPRANKTGWAHVAIFNWDSAESVSLDLSTVTGLGVGDSYKLHNAQDYFTDIAAGTVPANQTISVDMRAVSHSIVARVGSTAVATTFPTFGAFVVEKVS